MNAGPDPSATRPSSRAFTALLVMVAVFVLAAASFSFARFDALKSHLHDTALISQSFWTSTQGRLFVNSINPEAGRSEYYFGNHFTPIWFLIWPFYWLVPSPKTLLLIQALVIGLGAVPIYGLARLAFHRDRPALLFAALYLLHPAVWFANLYDFHTESMSATFILYALLYLELGAWPQLALAAALAMGCKEHVSLVFFMLGLLMAVKPEYSRRAGILLAASSLAVFLAVNGLIIPAFSGSASHPYVAERYGHLGGSLAEVVTTAVLHPLDTAALLATPRHLYYLTCLLGPLLYLPLAAPLFLAIGLPTFLANGLSSTPITYDIGFYHSATLIPGIFWAAIRAAGPLSCLLGRRFKRFGPQTWALLLIGSALFWHMRAQSAILPDTFLPFSPHAHRSDYSVGDHERAVAEVVRLVPPDRSLSVQFNLAAHFTDRFELYQFPNRLGEAEYVLLDLTEPYRKRPLASRKFWLEFMLQIKLPRFARAVRELLADPRYGLLFARDGYLLFQRGARDGQDRATAAASAEPVLSRWMSYQGRGYGRDRRLWDREPATMPDAAGSPPSRN